MSKTKNSLRAEDAELSADGDRYRGTGAPKDPNDIGWHIVK
jgi:hypothetical protein